MNEIKTIQTSQFYYGEWLCSPLYHQHSSTMGDVTALDWEIRYLNYLSLWGSIIRIVTEALKYGKWVFPKWPHDYPVKTSKWWPKIV